MKRAVIFGGGTITWIRQHLALSAPAYGGTARCLSDICMTQLPEMEIQLLLTRMAGGPAGRESNDGLRAWVDEVRADPDVKIVFFSCAVCDWECLPLHEIHSMPTIAPYEPPVRGKGAPRLDTHNCEGWLAKLTPAEKLVRRFREDRKDLFLAAFKQTSGATDDEMYLAGLRLCKEASANLVLVNDMTTRLNMIVTPEESRYHVTDDRTAALYGLVEMAKLRSHLTFTRSTVVAGEPVPWNSELVPASLRAVVDYCIRGGAYKPFRGATVGHFACKVGDNTFLTSQRKTDFNNLDKIGLVQIVTDGPDTVLAYGAKPSVGGQSQRIVFRDHPGMDCIVHFHCPIREGSPVPVRSQYEFECGSHECGRNTSEGLAQFGNLKAVYLDQHGPNIVFNRNIDPQEVINFIEANFDLSQKTGGFVSLRQRISTPNTLDPATEVLHAHE